MSGDELPFDELASAYLDNEVTPDERAVVEADPQLLARADEFSGVRASLADTDVSSFDFDALMSGALAEYDTVIAAGASMASADTPDEPSTATVTAIADPGDSSAGRAVTSLADARRRKERRSGVWAALAAVAVVAGGVVLVSRVGGSESKKDLASSAAPDAAAATTAAAAPAAEAPKLAAAATEAPAPEIAMSEADAELQFPAATEAAAPAATEAPAADTAAPAAGAASETTIGSIDAPGAPTEDVAPTDTVALLLFSSAEQVQAFVRSLSPLEAEQSSARLENRCDVGGAPVREVIWQRVSGTQGVTGVLYLVPDRAAPTDAVIVDGGCGVLVRVPIGS